AAPVTGNPLRQAILEDSVRGLAQLQAQGAEGGEMFARTLVGHAADLRRFGRLAEAIEQYERALLVVSELRGPESLDVASLLNALGQLLQRQVRYEEAWPLFERSLEIRLEALGPTDLSVAVAHNNLGALLKAMGLYRSALPHYESALEIREQGLEAGDYRIANVLNNLGALMRALGRHAEGLDYYRRALANYEESRGPTHRATATCLNNYSGLLREAGRFEEARPLCERALSLHRAIWGPDHHRTATCLQNLAGILMWEGNDLQARRHLERALAINESSGRGEHKDTASILNDLAGVMNVQEEYEAARLMYQRALTIFETQVGERHPFAIKSLNNLAAILINLERYEEAAPLARRALRLREEALGSGHPQTAVVLNNVAFLERRLGHYAEARPLYERAYALWESTLGPDHPRTLRGRLNLAFLNIDVGRTEEAWVLIRSAVAQGQARARAVMGSLTEAERFHYLARLRYQLELQITLAQGVQDPQAEARTYAALMGWKGRISRSLFASREERALDPASQALMDELRRTQGELSKLVFSRDPGQREERDARLAQLLERRNALELELHRGSKVVQAAPQVEAAELCASLPEGSAVLDLFVHREYRPARVQDGVVLEVGAWSEDRLSAWVLRADGAEPLRISLGRAADIEAAIKAFLGDLVTRRGRAVGGAEAPARDTTLVESLWAPLAQHLEGVRTIFLSPDSFLGTLPFETLQLADDSYLIEHYAFVYLQDVGSLVTAEERAPIDDHSLLSVGDVDFRNRADGVAVAATDASSEQVTEPVLRSGRPFIQWAKLPATREESQLVHDLHEERFGAQTRRSLLQGPLPSEERLKDELSTYAF
ncbi:MAG: tetratricopeptide repeat protein, partial [Planctomycetota bacterium]